MNVHILASDDGYKMSVESFSSRQKMVEKKTQLTKHYKCYMFPPVPVERSVDGILSLASLINDIHMLGPVRVLERLENDQY